jgi:succinoglycan biosynthesis transport protein ExoP
VTQDSDRPIERSIRRPIPTAAEVLRTRVSPFDPRHADYDAGPDTSSSPPENPNPSRVGRWRRWWLIPLCTVLGAAGGLPRHSTPIPIAAAKYTSSALVKYESRAEGSDVRAFSVPREYVDLLRSELDQIADPENCARAARCDNLREALPWLRDQNLDDPQVRQIISKRLKKSFKANLLSSSQLVRIEATTDDRIAAAAICNAFADVFVAQCLAHVPRPGENQLDDIHAEMANSEKTVSALQAKKLKLVEQSDASDLEQQQSALTAQIAHYTAQRLKVESSRVESTARLARLSEPSADGIVEQFLRVRQQRLEEQRTLDKVYRDALAEQLACEKEYATERGSGKTEKHRDVILAADRLHRAQDGVAKRTAELSAQVDAGIAAEKDAAVGSAKAQASESIKVIDQQIADFDKKLAALDEKSRQLSQQRKQREEVKLQIEQVDADLQRENRKYDQLGEHLRDALTKVKPAATFELQVLRRATAEPATEPAGLARTQLLRRLSLVSIPWVAGGFAVGLFLTVASAGLSRPRRRVLQNEPFLGGPILGSIPIAAPPGVRASDRKVIQQGVAESFRNLRNSLLAQLDATESGKPHTLCITSPERGDGRSCIAVGLAISLAKAGRRVLLVDADLRSPALHRIFGVERSPGLCELIEGKAEPTDALVTTETDHLTLLRAGTPGVDPGQLLAWPDLASYLESLGRRFEHVIIDLGPLLDTPDSRHLIGSTQAALLVFPPESRPENVEEAVNVLRRNNANLLGVVRNRS